VENSQFEAVVIGGGPAGSAAAFALASNGIRTCVIDRSHFPRDKLCGGLLTLRSKKVFEKAFEGTWDEAIDGISNGISVFYRGESIADVVGYSAFFSTQRAKFDNFLLQLAQEKGASLLLNRAAKQIDFHQKSVALSDGSVVKFDYLVGADGVKSVVARELFGRSFNPSRIGFGLELNVARAEVPKFPNVPEIHLGAASWGYGWVFPKGEEAVLGVAGLHRKNPDLMDRFHHFLRSRCGHVPLGRIRGHFLPYGDFRSVPGTSDVLLAGDAAGLVDSLSGEGIAFAMQSGNAAGLSIVDHIHKGVSGNLLHAYLSPYREITRLIKLSNRYRALVFLPLLQGAFAKTLVGAEAIQRGYLDIFADEIGYEHMPTLIAKQFYQGCLKPRRYRGSDIRKSASE
jgi:geranylgeranyl reductase family protein